MRKVNCPLWACLFLVPSAHIFGRSVSPSVSRSALSRGVKSCLCFSHQRTGEPPGDCREGRPRSTHYSGLLRLLPRRPFCSIREQIPVLSIYSLILGLQGLTLIWLSVQLGPSSPESWGHRSLPPVHACPPAQVRGGSVLPAPGFLQHLIGDTAWSSGDCLLYLVFVGF